MFLRLSLCAARPLHLEVIAEKYFVTSYQQLFFFLGAAVPRGRATVRASALRDLHGVAARVEVRLELSPALHPRERLATIHCAGAERDAGPRT